MLGEKKQDSDSNDPFSWYWKGKSAKKHLKDGDMMTPALQSRRRTRSSAPGPGFLRMNIPRGLPIRRRPGGGTNPYRTEPGPGFWSGENLDRQLAGRELQCRPRDIALPSAGPPLGCCPSPAACPPPVRAQRAGPPIDPLPNRSPPDRCIPRHGTMGPRERPLPRQEYPPQVRSRSRHREFPPVGRRMSPRLMFPTPDIDDDSYSVDSDADTIYSDDSGIEPFPRGRHHGNPFRHSGRRGRRDSFDDDSILSGYLSDDLVDLEDRRRRHDRMFDRRMGDHGRGRLPRRHEFGPGFSGLRATSSESRRNWFDHRTW